MTDLRNIRVIAPNFKRRLSGVTATVIRLVPLQAQKIAICACAPEMPDHVPNVHWLRLLTMSRGARVWHARRNVEMIAGLALKRILGKKLKLLFTSASQRHHTGLTKWLIAQMDDIIATSAKSAAYLDRPSHIIHHGIDCDTFRPAEDKTKLRDDLDLPGGLLIGCFGRIRASKGTDIFVDAMLHLLPAIPDAKALIMGRATEKDQRFLADLQAKIHAADLQDRIRFLAEVPVWETPQFYQALDLYVAPQRWEGFGLTPLEAMACGVPVIATRVGAFDELIVDGKTGALVPPKDVKSMVAAIQVVLSDKSKLHAWSIAARNQMDSHFRIEGEARALIRIYEDLLGLSPS
ncbi:MAG: glycosyltransferase family 4 protein [Pseudomonadota bacterium]